MSEEREVLRRWRMAGRERERRERWVGVVERVVELRLERGDGSLRRRAAKMSTGPEGVAAGGDMAASMLGWAMVDGFKNSWRVTAVSGFESRASERPGETVLVSMVEEWQ
jgi:hypothetical protein